MDDREVLRIKIQINQLVGSAAEGLANHQSQGAGSDLAREFDWLNDAALALDRAAVLTRMLRDEEGLL